MSRDFNLIRRIPREHLAIRTTAQNYRAKCESVLQPLPPSLSVASISMMEIAYPARRWRQFLKSVRFYFGNRAHRAIAARTRGNSGDNEGSRELFCWHAGIHC